MNFLLIRDKVKKFWNICICFQNKLQKLETIKLMPCSNHRVSAFQDTTYPVGGTHFDWPWSDGRFRSGVSCHWIYFWPKGTVPPGFNLLWRSWVYCLAPEAPLLGECWRGPRYFWKCQTRVGFYSAPRPTLKKALCHTCLVGGTEGKY